MAEREVTATEIWEKYQRGADWHGKATTVLLYATMLIHLAWFNIGTVLSNILVGACTAMILLSGILYGIRNLRALTRR